MTTEIRFLSMLGLDDGTDTPDPGWSGVTPTLESSKTTQVARLLVPHRWHKVLEVWSVKQSAVGMAPSEIFQTILGSSRNGCFSK